MSYTLETHKYFDNFMIKLSKENAKRVLRYVQRLETDLCHFGKHLKYVKLWELIIGNTGYRIFYIIDENNKKVVLLDGERKSDHVYKDLQKYVDIAKKLTKED